MKMMIRAAIALLALSVCAPILAAGPTGLAITAPAGSVPSQAMTYDDGTGKAQVVRAANPLPITAVRNDAPMTLALANTPATAKTVANGGYYSLAQSCSAYGTVTFRQIGPDGSTPMTIVAKTSADVTVWPIAAGAVVDVTLSGTTACNVTLSRVS
ncbi:hypothetical protein FYJ91_20510 [Sphingomonas montanisoli]|uniref:Uncharacterized protein n=2 Tax=Sphingomonas montanisoli TaxID=2606412 RepID=A0A5D9BX90_9SPHN|nr:hypothetical protein FYJ91_20510 [Sphingomonas montanisoli]